MRCTHTLSDLSRKVAKSGISPTNQTRAKSCRKSKPQPRPNQRTAEVRPVTHGVGIRKEPVRKPRTPGVRERKDAGAGNREQRHGFGETVDRVTPGLAEQTENRRDQRARVANADPPHEVDDGESQPIGILMPQIPVPLMNSIPGTSSACSSSDTIRKPTIHPSDTDGSARCC